MTVYGFRPLTLADRAMFCAWLDSPHIGGWWQDGATEWALIAEDLDSGRCDMRIVEADGQPFAYVQDYDVREWDMPQYADLPDRARALDTFLGDADFVGKGHGAAYIRARALALLDAFPMLAVDPSPMNTRAIRAYGAAGFAPRRTVTGEEGSPVYVMTRTH